MDDGLLNTLATWFLYFVIYSIIGWLMEIIYCAIKSKKYVSRGFLFGPWCPIYGTGAVLFILATEWLNLPWFLNFFVVMIICAGLEYITSVLMEKIFDTRWWDYTDDHKMTINGRVALETSIEFGIGGLVILYLVHPVVVGMVAGLPELMRNVIAGALALVMLVDFILTVLDEWQKKVKR